LRLHQDRFQPEFDRMAAVHPSRMGLVPPSRPIASDFNDFDAPGGSDHVNGFDTRDEDRSHRKRVEDCRSSQFSRHGSRSPSPRHNRHHSRQDDGGRGRRASPTYESYDKIEQRQRQEEERMEAERQASREKDRERQRELDRVTPDVELNGGDHARSIQGNPNWDRSRGAQGRRSFFDQRRDQRSKISVNIWARSPSPPRISQHKDKKRSRSSKRRVSPTSSSEDSEEERKRRRKHRSKHRHRSDDSEESDDERWSRKRLSRRHRSREHSGRDGSRSIGSRSMDKEVEGEEEWVERPVGKDVVVPATKAVTVNTLHTAVDDDDDDDDVIGPQPAMATLQAKKNEREYGGALLRGEGTAMAAFVAEGARIPRRGEIGLESTQIEAYEKVGYVMSGSRHRRMNAVRLRKENQVISAEEKRSLLNLQAEEKAKREADIISDFRELVDTKLRAR